MSIVTNEIQEALLQLRKVFDKHGIVGCELTLVTEDECDGLQIGNLKIQREEHSLCTPGPFCFENVSRELSAQAQRQVEGAACKMHDAGLKFDEARAEFETLCGWTKPSEEAARNGGKPWKLKIMFNENSVPAHQWQLVDFEEVLASAASREALLKKIEEEGYDLEKTYGLP